MWSVCNNHLDCAMLLLKYTADINHKDNEGKTVLMHVCKLFQPSMTILFDATLVNKELNINTVDSDGWTALHWCSVNGHTQLVKKIIARLSLQPSTINMYDIYGRNSAMLAANIGHLEVLKELLRRGSTVDSVDKDGKSGLMLAARCDHVDCVVELHKHGADIDRIDSDGQSALFLAVSNYHLDCVKVLFRQGCMLQYRNNKNVAVMSIVSNDKVLLDVLVAAGCDVYSLSSTQREREKEHEIKDLMEQCRNCIRNNLFPHVPKSNFFTLVERQPLPRPLKRFLVFNIILDV